MVSSTGFAAQRSTTNRVIITTGSEQLKLSIAAHRQNFGFSESWGEKKKSNQTAIILIPMISEIS